jgi:hypothetical protein
MTLMNKVTALGVAVCGVAAVASCSQAPPTREARGEARIAITNVPPDGTCIQVLVTGTTNVERDFSVPVGASAVFNLNGLPLGTDTFVVNAFPSTCSPSTLASTPPWTSDPVMANVALGSVATVTASMHRNGRATVNVDFPEDAATDASTGPNSGGGACGAMGACPLGLSCCGTVCVNLNNDPLNCHSCGLACTGATSMCLSGACVAPICSPACASGQQCCDVPGPGPAQPPLCIAGSTCPVGCPACI